MLNSKHHLVFLYPRLSRNPQGTMACQLPERLFQIPLAPLIFPTFWLASTITQSCIIPLAERQSLSEPLLEIKIYKGRGKASEPHNDLFWQGQKTELCNLLSFI